MVRWHVKDVKAVLDGNGLGSHHEFNNAYRDKFEKEGFVFSGLSPDGKLVEIIELTNHPFFIASQFHPEFLSKPHQPHPLFKGFIAAAHAHIHQKPL